MSVLREEGGDYRPLDILLSRVEQNFNSVVEIRFPLQYLRFFRLKGFPDRKMFFDDIRVCKEGCEIDIIDRLAYAEMEVYGRGFVPQARWESRVFDLGQEVNFGQVAFGVSRWRREGEQLVAAPEASASTKVELKTGHDNSPLAYFGFDDMGKHVEVTPAEYERLKPRVVSRDPQTVGWRGPIGEDQNNWSFWSVPLRQSGEKPRVPRGRYAVLRVQLTTEGLWEFARVDSLVVESSPPLAEWVVGEVAVAGALHPEGSLAQVEAGDPTEFVYDLRAEFSGAGQPGFDAVRVLTPSAGVFRGLEMGEPLAAVTPDSTVEEARGFALYLPERISPDGAQRLRLWLETAVYGAAGEIGAEVFERDGVDLPQGVEGSDASEEIGTNQLRVVARASSLGSVLAKVEAQPAVFTPQGDGVNDEVQIGYTLFRLLETAEVEVEVFTLSGKRVYHSSLTRQGAGRHRVAWDGRDDQGQLVGPGLYLVRVEVKTDEGREAQVQTMAVVY